MNPPSRVESFWSGHLKLPISGRKNVAIMLAYATSGIILAIMHHFYYLYLDGKQSGTAGRQQWAMTLGTGFSFLVIALLRTAITESYNQYIWNLIKRNSYSISALDKLFALNNDPLGFCNLELLKHAKLGVGLALVGWLMALAGVTPPGTLSIVPGQFSTTSLTPWASLDYNSSNWAHFSNYSPFPSPMVLKLATQAAESMQIVPIAPPASNSSYSIQTYGPSLQCKPANSTEMSVFEYYQSVFASNQMIMTQSTFQSLNASTLNATEVFANNASFFNNTQAYIDTQIPVPFMLQFSAFAPMLALRSGYNGILVDLDASEPGGGYGQDHDQYNNWAVDLPDDFDQEHFYDIFSPYITITPLQLFVQTASESFVCTLWNSSYEIDFHYEAGVQTVIPTNVTHLEPTYVVDWGGEGFAGGVLSRESLAKYAYLSTFIATTNMLSGNVTTTISDIVRDEIPKAALNGGYNTTRLYDTSSRVLETGLTSCDEFTNNYWFDNPIGPYRVFNNNTNVTSVVPVFSNQSNLDISAQFGHKSYTNDLFQDQPSWMCRNRTLMHAIEDLSHNITISMLNSDQLTKPNSTMVNITYFPTQNMYQYNSRNLILSYSLAIFVTVLGVFLGVYSFSQNGIYHNTAFSAVVATTRNPSLDAVAEDRDVKLRLGVVLSTRRFPIDELEAGGDSSPKLAFSVEDTVKTIKRRKT